MAGLDCELKQPGASGCTKGLSDCPPARCWTSLLFPGDGCFWKVGTSLPSGQPAGLGTQVCPGLPQASWPSQLAGWCTAVLRQLAMLLSTGLNLQWLWEVGGARDTAGPDLLLGHAAAGTAGCRRDTRCGDACPALVWAVGHTASLRLASCELWSCPQGLLCPPCSAFDLG